MVMTSSALWMVKMPVYQIVGVFAVRNCLMPTTRPMVMSFIVAPALVIGCA
jgi:hypothetical protein